MIEKLTINPATGKLQKVSRIPELDYDPSSPKAEDAWVLRQPSSDVIEAGTPIGLLMALTYADTVAATYSYQFSYRTQSGTTVRVPLVESDPVLAPTTNLETESGESLTTETGEELTTE